MSLNEFNLHCDDCQRGRTITLHPASFRILSAAIGGLSMPATALRRKGRRRNEHDLDNPTIGDNPWRLPDHSRHVGVTTNK